MATSIEDVMHCLEEFLKELKSCGLLENYTLTYDVNPRDCNSARFYNLLQHIAYLKSALESLPNCDGQISDADSIDIYPTNHPDMDTDQALTQEENNDEHHSYLMREIDPSMIQIGANQAEINRRIAAFMEKKRNEVNENNKREFCNVIGSESENSCARADAVFTPRSGSKSHVKVSRVINEYGPQTKPPCGPAYRKLGRSNAEQIADIPSTIDERLMNMESHLKLKSGHPIPKDIYSRLKRLEDKILELDGISPEYFQNRISDNYINRSASYLSPYSQSHRLASLHSRIANLRQSMRKKKESLV